MSRGDASSNGWKGAPWLVAALLAVLLTATSAEPVHAVEPGTASPLSIPRVDAPIQVDGVLDEEAWQQALTLTLDYEVEATENTPAPVRTECLLAHDDSHLYVAFRAFDPEPSRIRAHLADRDTPWDDDWVLVALDTFNDQRRMFLLGANPLGVQLDLVRNEVTGQEDAAWDAIWDSAGRLTEEGYTVEMAIPFSSLRFQRGNGAQTWGVTAVRNHPRSRRNVLATNPFDRDNPCLACQTIEIRGFEGVEPGRNLEVAPTLTASATERRQPAGGLARGESDLHPGITARWGMTPNMTLSATANPDFSQVEADAAQLDLNVQFALFFPEKRPFFLEGADLFETPLRTVHTRNVADPSWGLKLTGKEEDHGVGLFIVQDEVTNLLIPGSQSSDLTALAGSSLASVLRYRRDVGASSTLGALVTSREGDGYSNRVAGLDGLLRVTTSDSIRFQLLGSRTRYPGDVAADFDQPLGEFGGNALRLDYRRSGRDWSWGARLEDVASDFRGDLGFLPRVDYRLARGDLVHNWVGTAETWYTRIFAGGEWQRTEEQSGQLLEQTWALFGGFGGPWQSFVNVSAGVRDRFFDGVLFDELFLGFSASSQPRGELQVRVSGRLGDDIDFANTQPAETVRLSPGVRINIGPHARLSLDHTYQRLDVEEGRLFTANLSQLQAVYQLDVRTFVRGIFQYTHIDRDLELYLDPVASRTERLFSQLLFSYKINPQTVLFVGYSDNHRGGSGFDFEQTDRTLFLKVGYAWVT